MLARVASRTLLRQSGGARLLRPASALTRFSSTESKPSPSEAASSLINMFPGANLTQKAGSVLLTSSIAAWLISKEIYLVDHEFFEMGCLLGAYYIWYSAGKGSALEWLTERQNTLKNVLNQAREEHKAVVKERMAHISKLADVVNVTKGLFATAKDIARLEAEAYELKQKVAYTNEVKAVLDSWVRHEASLREAEQKQMAASIIAKIRADLSDPKLQASILQQTVTDIESISSKK